MSKILIIDAEGTLRDVLKAVLSQAGHEVVTTADGMAGVEAYRQDRPDLVLLDRGLPEMMGVKVMGFLRALDEKANVIVLNRIIDHEEEGEYRRMGARIFLSKAVGIDILLKVVARSLRQESGALGYDGYDKNSRPEILVVDDDVRVRDMLMKFLESKGYAVCAAKSGEEALRGVESSRPQMILLDVKMPKMNGVEVLQAVRKINARVPIMMITGQNDIETVRECLRLGAFDYMLKPLNFEYLETSVWGKLLTIV